MAQPPEEHPDATRELGGWASLGPYGPPPGVTGAEGPVVPPLPPPGHAAPTTSPKATWALVIGIISLVMGCCGGVLGLVGVASVVLGIQARREIAASAGRLTGDGAAIAGLVTGAVGAGGGLLTSVVGFAMFATGSSFGG